MYLALCKICLIATIKQDNLQRNSIPVSEIVRRSAKVADAVFFLGMF